jgi:hypothetical protein
MSENLGNDQINRLWDYKLHLENIYYNRHNFFLVFESVMLGVVGVLFSRSNPERLVLKVIAILGLSLTIVWGYAQARQVQIIDDLETFLEGVVPEYRPAWRRWNRLKWPSRTMWILTYIVPILVALVWIVFLFFL